MKAVLVRHEKFIVRRRYTIEISVHQVGKSEHYPDGLKWGLICFDQTTKRRVLMDNHKPKGPHLHIDDTEVAYEFSGLDQLVDDFRRFVRDHMGVKI